MKRFLIALFVVFACCQTFAEPAGGFIPQIPPIYAHPDVVEYAIGKYVVAPYDPNKVTVAYEQYMNQNDGTITLENLQQKVCPAGGMDYARCKEFTNALMIPYYDVCDSGKGKSDGNEHCEKNFFYYAAPKNLSFGNGTYVRTKEAIGLAQEYALVKDKQKVVCVSTKGNSKKTDTIWCTSIDKKHFYEFKFNNIKETKDDHIKQSLLGAICKLHNTQYSAGGIGAATLGSAQAYSRLDSCETADKFICTNINKSLGRFSYKATIGTSDVPPTGKYSTCVIEKVVSDISNLRSAYGIDPSVFKNIQALAGEDIDKKIKQYVKQELQKQKITFDEKSFHCADSTNVLNGGDVLTCYVNNKPIDFLFKDLSEWSGVNKRGGAQAMDCIVSGGTYTGKRCTNLNQKQCEMLRRANLKSCPSCNMVRWDAKNKVCTLPSSAAATNLQKDLKVVAIVGGAVAGAAITIATAGTAGLTAGGYIILGVETTGAGIELWAQSKIDKLSDEFFLKANNCNNENCAAQLIEQYLTDLAAIDRDLTADEADAIDKEMARLFEFIPTNSNWWIDKLRNEDGTSFLEKANDGHWTAAQVWRAIGIGMQFAGVAASATKWVLTKTGYLTKTLDRTTKILEQNAKIAKSHWIRVETLSDVDKEWYKLWQEYAPKNQTFEKFKAMTNGDLNEMKQMTKGWISRTEATEKLRPIYRQLAAYDDELTDFEKLMEKYNIADIPTDPIELQKLYAQHPDFAQAHRSLANQNARITSLKNERDALINRNYSTYDSEFSRVVKSYDQRLADLEQQFQDNYQTAFAQYKKRHPRATEESFKQNSFKYQRIVNNYNKQYVQTITDFQWEIGKDFPLENLENVAMERMKTFWSDQHFRHTQLHMDDQWSNLDLETRASHAQAIANNYAMETGTPLTQTRIDPNTTAVAYNETGTNIITHTPYSLSAPDEMADASAHEAAHMIDALTPNEGALGEQYYRSTIKKYPYSLDGEKMLDAGYRVALTEQSAYKIGSVVSGLNPFVGQAKNINETVSSAIISSSAAALGVAGIKQKQEHDEKKTIFEKYNQSKKD